MRYGQIRNYDVANGPGVRVSIFTTGCTHNCYNCFNKEYQDFNYGQLWTQETTEDLIKKLSNKHIKGLSILGGEPMQNAKDLYKIIQDIKDKIDINIWLWSGYTFEEILNDEDMFKLLKEVDVLVDGPFKDSLRDLNLVFRGSSNQRIIDVATSLCVAKVIELDY